MIHHNAANLAMLRRDLRIATGLGIMVGGITFGTYMMVRGVQISFRGY